MTAEFHLHHCAISRIARANSTFAACVLLFCLARPVLAQTTLESNIGIQFDFVNPGARSLALGGAFIAAADDATAAFTNPAGLRFISRKEFSLEGRYREFVTPYVSGGRLGGSATHFGLDQTDDLETSDSRESIGSVSFLSLVYPRPRWALALYRQQVSNFRFAATNRGVFFDTSTTTQTQEGRFAAFQGELALNVARYGVSGSLALGDKASVGLSAMIYNFSMNSETRRYNIPDQSPASYGAIDYTTSNLRNRQTQNGDDRTGGASVGILLGPFRGLQLASVYRKGAHLGVTVEQAVADPTLPRAVTDAVFSIPDTLGFGLAVRATDAVRIMLDYNRVRYSTMANSLTLLRGETAVKSDFKVDDANEVRTGLEYTFLRFARPVAVRIGSWYDPDHALRYEPSGPETTNRLQLAVFRKGKNVVHFTGGGGMSLGRLELNVGGDFSARGNLVSVSTVVRF